GGNTFLLGAEACIADFSVYHALWFIRRVPAVAGIFDGYPLVTSWMDQVAAFGHGEFEKCRSGDAIDIARNAEPVPFGTQATVDAHGIALGEQVSITPVDYALDPVVGELVVASQNELAVRRQDARAGTVVVHFPRLGFQMKRV
ncbi:MAG: glutathione S-transferase family protein, partial [Burkholderiales bacterium]|nr:glutathione S-transferase family protein [Burkholderiales bacterium]